MNGYVEDFEAPVTVEEVTGKPPTHVLLSSAHLLAFGSNPLRPDDCLEPGRLYFLLPHAVFQSESSPVDLATLMTRLTTAAKRGGVAAPPQPPSGPVWLGLGRSNPMASRARTWRPELDPIEERSFGRSMGRDSMNSSMRSFIAPET
ncbi:hypothetical protein MUK42_19386 [Musa troglodytarum]|nr:hypothetical protein MUK42_19386 [Musa troglodytarum]